VMPSPKPPTKTAEATTGVVPGQPVRERRRLARPDACKFASPQRKDRFRGGPELSRGRFTPTKPEV
jgi:hypothetical protein